MIFGFLATRHVGSSLPEQGSNLLPLQGRQSFNCWMPWKAHGRILVHILKKLSQVVPPAAAEAPENLLDTHPQLLPQTLWVRNSGSGAQDWVP